MILRSRCFLHSFLLPTGQYSGKCRPDVLSRSAVSMEDKCACFSEPNLVTMEFYSPLFPSNYPNDTECILRLEGKCSLDTCCVVYHNNCPSNYIVQVKLLYEWNLTEPPMSLVTTY